VSIATSVLARLKSDGFRIALDDFGVRASSLTFLKQWPIDVLKIDRAFIRNIATDGADAAIAGAIISLARNLRVEPAQRASKVGWVTTARRPVDAGNPHAPGASPGYAHSQRLGSPLRSCNSALALARGPRRTVHR
jgi:predicted signal transduction protein with EAL and GGDEF domain